MVDVVDYQSPSSSDMSNEVVLLISGDSGAVKQAVKAARDVGLALLETMGERPKNKGNAYIYLMNKRREVAWVKDSLGLLEVAGLLGGYHRIRCNG